MTGARSTSPDTGTPPARHGHRGGTTQVLRGTLAPRLRSPRWWRLLLLWTGATCAGSAAVGGLAVAVHGDGLELSPAPGSIAFGWVTLLLTAALLVVAASTTARVTGPPDAVRAARPVPAPTSGAARLVGGWLASWAITALFVLASAPALLGVLVLGDVPASAPARVLALAVPLTGTATAVAAAFTSRARTAEVARRRAGYAVAAGAVGTVLAFLLAMPLVSRTEPVHVEVPVAPGSFACGDVVVEERTVRHTEHTWPLLALNPFVVVGDAAFTSDPTPYGTDPLSALSHGARAARAGAPDRLVECGGDGPGVHRGRADQQSVDTSTVWPWGLAGTVVLGGAALAVAARDTRRTRRA